MNELMLFENPEFGSVRTMEMNGEPWFVGRDICRVFGDKNESRSLSRVDDVDKQVISITDSIGRNQNAIIVNESGMYALLFAMQPQKAHNNGVSDEYPIEIRQRIDKLRKFKHWVTSEILPSIRKTGSYSITAKPDSYMIDDPIERAKRWIEEEEDRRQLRLACSAKDKQIEEMQPKATYYDIVMQCKDLLSTTQIAKDYGVSARWLNNWLYEHKVQYKQGGVWVLYQKYANKGYTGTKTYTYDDSNGVSHGAVQTQWTFTGRLFIYGLMKKNGILPLVERVAS